MTEQNRSFEEILKIAEKIENKKITKKLIDALPKTEIHVHIEALVSIGTLLKLNTKYNIDNEVVTANDLIKKYNIHNYKDLDSMINAFLNIQLYFKSEEDIVLLVNDARDYMLRNNIYYMEFFFSPTYFCKNGLDFFVQLDVIENELRKIEAKDNLRMNLILDISRTFGLDNAKSNLDNLLKFKDQPGKGKKIIGIGLGGKEKENPAGDFKDIYAKAAQYKLKLVAHAGEDVGSESVWSALKDLNAARIGHGISAVYDDELMDYLVTTQIPLEICMTSNLKTGKYVKNLNEHPIKIFYKKGIMVTVNSDDPILFEVELNEEFFNLHKYLNFSLKDILLIIKNNLFATFLQPEEIARLWDSKLTIIKEVLQKAL